MKKITFILLFALTAFTAKAQILNPVKWSYAAKKINAKEAVIYFKATIDDGWHIYSTNMADGGPVKTSFTFNPSKTFTTRGSVTAPKPISKFEKVFNMEVSYFEYSVIFQQKITLNGKTPVKVSGSLEFMTCNDKQCLQPEEVSFSVSVN